MSAMASLAVPASVAELMAGVGLEAASLRAASLKAVGVGPLRAVVVGSLRAVVVGFESAVDDADEGIRAIATAVRIGANSAEGQNARDENSGKTSLDR